ncbi:MAG: HAMP domain-containing histidine kinase [Erysipelotrichaceae bacterium]|nr:HAMP domain-containing histidine kinase [Erysipelotrichaceae bacterium]
MMKSFFKTILGKAILFVLCVLALALLAGSGIGAAAMAEEDFYTRSKEEIYFDVIGSRLISDLYTGLDDLSLEKDLYEQGPVTYGVYDHEGNLIASCETYKENKDAYIFRSLKDEEGRIVEIFYDYNKAHADNITQSEYLIKAYLNKDYGKDSFYSFTAAALDKLYPLRYGVYWIIGLSAIVSIVSFIALMCVSGRSDKDEDIHPGLLNKVPFDVLLVLTSLLMIGCMALIMEDPFHSDVLSLIAVILWLLALIIILVGLSMSAACRIKQKNLVKGSLCYKLWVIIWSFIKYCFGLLRDLGRGIISFIGQLPLIFKAVIAILAISLFEMIVLFDSYNMYISFWFIKTLILVPFVLYIALNIRRLQKGAEALSSGDLAYQIDTRGMLLDFRKQAEDLNQIGKGMAIAVEDRLKSERMKTELITNVSHDIKTPLTSIINYTDLISKEKGNNRKVKEYCEVLLRQAERLKRLLEDLVEASKASSGNLEVDLRPFDVSIFLNQASGEYEEKLGEAKLELISEYPPKEVMIKADGRRMWRVFDNLMNNICKYAQSDTRVYLSLDEKDDRAIITLKNTSRDKLNMSPDELMERFTRGDESRHSEGNGLGLAIARSLTELQNGQMDLSIDGDLFKVTLSFPLL